jgi:hypothetical protein
MDFSTLVVTCVLAVSTPSGGQICVKSDGSVTIPADTTLDQASRDFWQKLAASYPSICDFNKSTKP